MSALDNFLQQKSQSVEADLAKARHRLTVVSGSKGNRGKLENWRTGWWFPILILNTHNCWFTSHYIIIICLLNPHLVGGFKHLDYFPFQIWDNPEPIDELIFFKMVETSNQTILDKGKSSIVESGRSYIIIHSNVK